MRIDIHLCTHAQAAALAAPVRPALCEPLSPTGYTGLINLGAICYMNSLLQQLYMVPAFRCVRAMCMCISRGGPHFPFPISRMRVVTDCISRMRALIGHLGTRMRAGTAC